MLIIAGYEEVIEKAARDSDEKAAFQQVTQRRWSHHFAKTNICNMKRDRYRFTTVLSQQRFACIYMMARYRVFINVIQMKKYSRIHSLLPLLTIRARLILRMDPIYIYILLTNNRSMFLDHRIYMQRNTG